MRILDIHKRIERIDKLLRHQIWHDLITYQQDIVLLANINYLHDLFLSPNAPRRVMRIAKYHHFASFCFLLQIRVIDIISRDISISFIV